MNCRDAEPLLHARLDGELDVAGSLAVDRHLSECRACAAQYAALDGLHREIASAEAGYPLPPALERRLAAHFIGQTASPRSLWRRPWSAAFLLAAAACLALLAFTLPRMHSARETDALAAEILDSHLRALETGHLVDVPSSDRHTVKPWFQGRTAFAPPVPDLANAGFLLIGGRLEVLRQQPAAAIVYQRRQHVISLYVSFSAGADAAPDRQELRGYHLLHWSHGGMAYWAVSDIAVPELRDFATLVTEPQ
jgi:anti-sigma factor RsiW